LPNASFDGLALFTLLLKFERENTSIAATCCAEVEMHKDYFQINDFVFLSLTKLIPF